MKIKQLKAGIAVESKGGNRYFYDRQKNTSHLVHPIFHYLLKLEHDGEDLETWLNRLQDDPLEIKPYGLFPRKRVEYYYRKYRLLKSRGYFSNINQEEQLSAQVTPDKIRRTLANVKQITLEVTDNCNLDCQYCGYGKFYSDYDKRESKNMEPATAKRLLDFFAGHWNSSLNTSHDRRIALSFYGGEPLMNFPFIREVVSYANQLELTHNHISYSMTTNGLLLKKHIDFLVHHQFRLLISLDGDEINNVYRLTKNGSSSYKEVISGIEELADKYPDYFKNNVNFNAVLHNKNSVDEIFHFFKQKFDKIPFIGALNTSGIRESQKENFWKMYANARESLYKSEDYTLIEKEMFINLPNIRDVSTFLHRCHDSVVSDYNALLFPTGSAKKFPTGTCVPFSKKVFVTVNGKIMPCERIGQQFSFGHAGPEGILLDEEEAAKSFNDYISRIRKQCTMCFNTRLCNQCVFNLPLEKRSVTCNGFMNSDRYSKHLASYFDFLEQKPELYTKLLKEVIIEN